jgi:ABC-type multidrug transport system fused ATPase/permease subunit
LVGVAKRNTIKFNRTFDIFKLFFAAILLLRFVYQVDQNVRLFNDSVKGNIALGQIQNMSDEKIENAAKIANAYDFVEA